MLPSHSVASIHSSFEGDAIQDLFCQIPIRRPGAYDYHLEHDVNGTKMVSGSGAFVVDPRLMIKCDEIQSVGHDQHRSQILLPLDGINILTVIPKWMPILSAWLPYFRAFSNTGYNMVHLAPINARGISNSPYAIYDQLSISNDLFEESLNEDQKQMAFKETLDLIHTECSILVVTDVVWNHTSCDSAWLLHHPDAGYNLKTAPYLRPAYELDEALMAFSENLASYQCPDVLKSEDDLKRIVAVFKDKVLPKVSLWEFHVINVAKIVEDFECHWFSRTPSSFDASQYADICLGQMSIFDRAARLAKDALLENESCIRFGKSLDLRISFAFIDKLSLDLHITSSQVQVKLFKEIVDEINLVFYKEYDADCAVIIDQITNRARYIRVMEHGPRLGKISRHTPIVDTYFTRLPRNVITKDRHPDELVLANNGWIWNADPLVNFAAKGSKAYIRRELIVWGDCVKLRYGDKPSDSPYLWEHQAEYTRIMARLFNGLRIDNCHSTPLHVASYFLDVARAINPDLYVFAELFTGSEEKDILFVSKLGINSLIREAMNAWEPQELGRQLHRQGGDPVGCFTLAPDRFPLEMLGHDLRSSFYHSEETTEHIVAIQGSKPHNLFMDCTHDNETPYQKRTAEDTLPNAAIVAMASAAIGSVFGYDQIVPELLDVVGETRKYRLPDPSEGIIPSKAISYGLHEKMGREGYTEIHVHTEGDYIIVHRVHPITHDGYLLIARTAFKNSINNVPVPIILKNQAAHVIQSATLTVHTGGQLGKPYDVQYESDPDELHPPQTPTQMYHSMNFDDLDQAFKESAKKEKKSRKVGVISGMPSTLEFSTNMSHITNRFVESLNDQDSQTIISIDPSSFVPGSIVLYRTCFTGDSGDVTPMPSPEPSPMSDVVLSLSTVALGPPEVPFLDKFMSGIGFDHPDFAVNVMNRLGYSALAVGETCFASSECFWPPGLREAVGNLDAKAINLVLYRTAAEELDTTGDSVYDIPGYGPLPYCGLQGFISAMSFVRNNDLGHPMCNNLRQGPWMMDYVHQRLVKFAKVDETLNPLKDWLGERLDLVKRLPASFIPKYFIIVIHLAYHAVKHRAIVLHPSSLVTDVRRYPHRLSSIEKFLHSLALTTYQVYGSVKSTGLFPRVYPFDIYGSDTRDEQPSEYRAPCLAAGLPHFATQHMRCWGRDIFIALPGLLILPGHFAAARAHIIAFGSTLKHGLIPNLLDQGNRPRYNARDATWFWLNSVAEFCARSPEGYSFLNVKVGRRFVPKKRYTSGPDFCNVSDDPALDHPLADDYIDPFHEKVYSISSTIGELCQEIMDRHARGISFTEWNAGPNLDHAMKLEGFHIHIRTHWDEGTGFISGGNQWNCGTWMDKMGDSDKAGTKGLPATPRDGVDIELVALLKSTLDWIVSIPSEFWPWKGVTVKESLITYQAWGDMIQDNFDKYFYVPLDASLDKQFMIETELVRQRGIYKDTVGASFKHMDYQLRPNVAVAMALCPSLFDPDHAKSTLESIGKNLVGPLGLKTLDPNDPSYRGYYENGNDSFDGSIAHGFNYHQGPEWLWPMPYYLISYLHFFGSSGPEHFEALGVIQRILLKHKVFLHDTKANPFAGLPELTNENGSFCAGSCPTQSWSSSGMILLISAMFAQ